MLVNNTQVVLATISITILSLKKLYISGRDVGLILYAFECVLLGTFLALLEEN